MVNIEVTNRSTEMIASQKTITLGFRLNTSYFSKHCLRLVSHARILKNYRGSHGTNPRFPGAYGAELVIKKSGQL